MTTYNRLGSYLTVSELAGDPFGKIHRGLTIAGSAFERHCLLRTFSEEFLNAGLSSRSEEIGHNVAMLLGSRGFGANYQVEGGKTPHIACDYIPGRNLAQMIDKAKVEQIPLGVDHALSVLQGLAQALIGLDNKGLHHGILSPYSIWISFEGAAHILDAPYACVLGSMLPKCPVASASLARYRPSASSALHQDLFALGAILYELLTFEKLPAQDQIPAALSHASLKAAQDDAPIPAEILGLLNRLLLVSKPFESTGAFNAELESVLYDGDYSPTTFNMAFFMHTLFREENDHDNQAMKVDQAADFTPFIQTSDTSQRSVLNQGPDRSVIIKWGVMATVVIALAVGGLAWAIHVKGEENRKLQEELAKVQNALLSNQQKLADLGSQEMSAARATQELADKAAKAKGEEKAKLEKELAEAKKKQEDIQKQKAEAMRTQQELQTRTTAIAQLAQSQPTLPPATPAPATPQPTPQPVVQTPQPTQAPVVPAVQQQATYTEEVPPTLSRRAGVNTPRVGFVPPSLRNTDLLVVVRVQVDAQGRPTKAFVVKGIDALPAYNDSAREAALASSYSPATKDGRPVAGTCSVDYKFRVR